MGKVFSMMIRPIRNYNAEQRAHKFISREKPKPAPQYETTKRQLKLSQKLDSQFMERHYKKDAELNANLKNVFVTSEDPKPKSGNKSASEKPLPKIRKSSQFGNIDLYNVKDVREGRCSLYQIQTFLTNHMDNPQKYNNAFIAEQYKLDSKVTENLLEYYKVFRVLSKDDIKNMGKKDEVKKIESVEKSN